PACVIQILESLRSKFFNGHESSGKKASWVQWKKALAPKDNGGLDNELHYQRPWKEMMTDHHCQSYEGEAAVLLMTSKKKCHMPWKSTEIRPRRLTPSSEDTDFLVPVKGIVQWSNRVYPPSLRSQENPRYVPKHGEF
ncbi:hypothetical protein Tco_0482351, partial [Tanacetum coccineum]